MHLHTWWLFVGVTFVVSATPGPNMLLVMSMGARVGFRRAMATMLGCLSAVLLMITVSALGLGALLQASPTLFNVMRWVGAIYLAYLGIQSWRAPLHDLNTSNAPESVAPTSQLLRHFYRQGFLVASSNPKAILFAVAFLPQFIDADLPKLTQFFVLITTFTTIEIAWYLIYAICGTSLSVFLRKMTVQKMFNRGTGAVFVGFAVWMATSMHA